MIRVIGGLLLAAGICGCQSQQQVVDEMQADATEVAQERGEFELNCPTATASVLSKKMIQPLDIMTPQWAWALSKESEYTVRVHGCDKLATYLVVCAEGGTGCIAAEAQNQIEE